MATRRANQMRARRGGSVKPGTLDAMLAALSSRERRGLLLHLAEGPQDVSSLTRRDRDSISLVSYRLGALLDNGLVRITKDGTRRVYQLGDCIRISDRAGKTTVRVVSRDRAETIITLQR